MTSRYWKSSGYPLGPGKHFLASGLVLPSGLIVDFDPASLALSNGASVASWTDSKSGIVAAAASNQPTFVANALNGKPGVAGNATQYLPIASPGVYDTTVSSKNYTLLDIVINTAASSFGCTGGADGAGLDFFPTYNLSRVGRSYPGVGSQTYTNYPWTSTGFTCFGWTSSTANHGGSASSGLTRYFLQGMPFGADMGVPRTGPVSTYAMLAGDGTGFKPFNGTLLRRLVWNRELSPAEYLSATLAMYSYFGVTHPLASSDHIYLFGGNSLIMGVQAGSVETTMPYLVASNLSLPVGTWGNLGIGGLTTANLASRGSTDFDPYASVSPKSAIIFTHDAANDAQAAVSAATQQTNLTSFVTGRKAAFTGAKYLTCTPSDWANVYNATSPAAYSSNLVTNYAAMGFDGLARVDLDATIGSNGGLWNTYPETGQTAPFCTDGVHFTTYTYHANVVGPAVTALR